MQRFIALVITLSLVASMVAAGSPVLAKDVAPVIVEEVFTSATTPLVAVVRDQDDAYRLVTADDFSDQGLTYALVDDRSTLVVCNLDGTEPVELPILHAPLPLNVLTAALVRCEGKQLVLAAQSPDERILYSYRPGEALEELTALWEAAGCSLVVSGDVVLVGAVERCATMKETVRGGGTAVTVDMFDASMKDIAAALASVGEFAPTGEEGTVPVTLCVEAMPVETIVGYVKSLTGVLLEKMSPTVKPATEKQIFKRVITLARRDEVVRARRLLAKLMKRTEPCARYYVAFFQLSWKLGDRTRALKALKKALELEPTNEYARRAVRKIRKAATLRSAA